MLGACHRAARRRGAPAAAPQPRVPCRRCLQVRPRAAHPAVRRRRGAPVDLVPPALPGAAIRPARSGGLLHGQAGGRHRRLARPLLLCPAGARGAGRTRCGASALRSRPSACRPSPAGGIAAACAGQSSRADCSLPQHVVRTRQHWGCRPQRWRAGNLTAPALRCTPHPVLRRQQVC